MPIVSWKLPTATQVPAAGQLTAEATAFGIGPSSMVKGSVVDDGIDVAADADPTGTTIAASANRDDAAMHFATVRAVIELKLM